MSKTCWIFVTSVFVSFGSAAQIELRPIPKQDPDTQLSRSLETPITLPFWDDFSTSIAVPDSNLWEIGRDVFINNTLAINPPSLNAATLDGANQSGGPHNAFSETPGPADSLISRAIDLTSVGNRSAVTMSFFWQIQGNGEIPESLDSLRLQFFASDSTWRTVFVATGGVGDNNDSFEFVQIPIRASVFFHPEFRIKFQSFSAQSGIFDTWHIDYVYLNENRINTRILDRTISRGPGPLFGEFYQIPFHQFILNPNFVSQSVVVSNLDNTVHPLDYIYTIRNLNTNTILHTEQLIGPILLPLESREVFATPTISFDPLVNEDSIVLESEFFYRTGDRNLFEQISDDGDTLFLDIDLTVNDTIRTQYTLNDQYAYDDGTAEFAAGINLDQGQLAVQFIVPEQDTLTHLALHFPSLPSNEGKPLDLIIWRELSDDGEIGRQSYSVSPAAQRNQFEEVTLLPPIVVNDTFYVGYQQFTDEYVGIGLDKSNNVADNRVFFNTTRTWQQNDIISGALMIRPIFRPTSAIILDSPKPREPLSVFPNPSNGHTKIEGLYDRLAVLDLLGKQVDNFYQEEEIDLTHLEEGVYILHIERSNEIITKKLIIRKP